MNIDNVVLVRAMNNLPLNGELLPSSEGVYFKADGMLEFNHLMRKKVKQDLEKSLGRYIDVYNEEDATILKEACKPYEPVSSNYTSVLSFSLNGLVPDDINNKFSKMPIAVIIPIKELKEANFVNIHQIDSSIKGKVEISNKAILVIEKNKYESLTEEEKINLISNYKIELFIGELSLAVKETLEKYNYPALSLTDKVEEKYIKDCSEKESLIKFQDEFADSIKASRLRLTPLYKEPLYNLHGNDLVASEKFRSDFDKNNTVQAYYKEKFYDFWILKCNELGMELSELDKYYIINSLQQGEELLNDSINYIIEKYGISCIKQIISEFNELMYKNYLTPEEIVSLNSETRK